MKCSVNTDLARKDLEKLTLGLLVSHADQVCSTHIEIKRRCWASISDSEPCSAKQAEPRDCLYFQVLRTGDGVPRLYMPKLHDCVDAHAGGLLLWTSVLSGLTLGQLETSLVSGAGTHNPCVWGGPVSMCNYHRSRADFRCLPLGTWSPLERLHQAATSLSSDP